MRKVKRLDDIGVREKLLLLYVFCVLLPILTTNIVFYSMVSHDLHKREIEHLNNSLARIEDNINKTIMDSITLSHSLYTDRPLINALDEHYDSTTDLYTAFRQYLGNALTRYIHVYPNISNVTIFTDNTSISNSSGFQVIDSDIIDSEWYKAWKKNDNEILVYSYIERTFRGNEPIFCIIRGLNRPGVDQLYEKILKIDLTYHFITRIINEERLDGRIYLIDRYNKRVFDSESNSIFPDQWALYKEHNEATQFILQNKFPNTYNMAGWKIIGLFSEDNLHNVGDESVSYIKIMAFINILFSTSIILIIAKSLTSRLHLLAHHMEGIRHQKFDLIDHASGEDEIGKLFDAFNRMATRIRELIHNVYQADIQKKNLDLARKQAEINALQTQINPHFLFNTLEAIRMRSIMKDEYETATMIKYLSKSIRHSLVWDSEYITIREEISYIEDFLKIQQYRFNDKINYNIIADDSVMVYRIPKMAIQPFVENACIHGIEGVKREGHITVKIEIDRNFMSIAVIDNGIGIEESELAKLLESIREVQGHPVRVGISNAYRRLLLLYGDDLFFDIRSKVDEGTKVEIRVPVDNTDEESADGSI